MKTHRMVMWTAVVCLALFGAVELGMTYLGYSPNGEQATQAFVDDFFSIHHGEEYVQLFNKALEFRQNQSDLIVAYHSMVGATAFVVAFLVAAVLLDTRHVGKKAKPQPEPELEVEPIPVAD